MQTVGDRCWETLERLRVTLFGTEPGELPPGSADRGAGRFRKCQVPGVFEQGMNFAGVLALDGTVIEANRFCLEACGFTRQGSSAGRSGSAVGGTSRPRSWR